MDWLSRWAYLSPQKNALIESDTGIAYTYAQLDLMAISLSQWLYQKYSMAKGDKLVIVGEFSGIYAVLLGLAQKTGIIIIPLNYRLAVKEIDYLMEVSDPSLLLYDEKFEKLIQETQWALSARPTFCIAQLPLDYESKVPFGPDLPNEEDPLYLLFTSGTTGRPKAVPYTHKMLTWNSIDTVWRLSLTSEDTTVMCMPPFHTGGLNVLFNPILHRGGTVVLQKKFEADYTLDLLEKHEATIFMAVPTIVKMLSESTKFEKVSLSKLRYFVVGGEALPIALIEKWKTKGVLIRQGYGLTEAGPSVTSLHQSDAIKKIGSIGKLNFYVEGKLVNESGAEVNKGDEGELWLRGPSVMLGYWKNEKANQQTFEKGWFKTGDMMREDEDGFLYMVDRIKNMYKSGGENIYPAEIEKAILLHSSVAEVAVIGIKDDKWGEAGKAFVVLKENLKLSETDMLAHCKLHLAKFKIPKSVVFLENLPKNDTGKIDKKKLSEL